MDFGLVMKDKDGNIVNYEEEEGNEEEVKPVAKPEKKKKKVKKLMDEFEGV
jgi:hypothetical protein